MLARGSWHLGGDFDVIIDGVGGATFGLAIEQLSPRGVVVNIATQDEEEMASIRPDASTGPAAR
jgi:NADPH:quinone reductase